MQVLQRLDLRQCGQVRRQFLRITSNAGQRVPDRLGGQNDVQGEWRRSGPAAGVSAAARGALWHRPSSDTWI